MDREHPEVARYFGASQRYGLGGQVPVLLEGPETRLDEALRAVEAALRGERIVRSVYAGPPAEWLRERAPWWVAREVFDAWIALARDPGDEAAAERLAAGLEAAEARHGLARVEGARLLLVTLADDPFEAALDADGFPRLRSRVRAALAGSGVTAEFAGMAAIVTQEQEATIARMRWLGPLSLVLVLLLLRRAAGSFAALAGLALPLLLAAGATLGVVGRASGKLTLIESVFGVMIFGLGVDFAIHWMLRVREERSAGRTLGASVERAVAGTGRGLIASGTTSGGAFLLLMLAPEPVFQRLGFSGGLGLLVCLVLLLAMLPAQQRWLGRGGIAAAAPLRTPGAAALIAHGCRHPGLVLALALALLCLGAVELPKLRYETDLSRVFSSEIRAVETARRIHALYGLDPRPWVAAASDLEEARALTARSAREPLFDRVDSAAFLFPADLDERRRQLAALPAGLDRAPDPIGLLARAARRGPPRLDALPAALDERLRGPDGELLVHAFAARPALDSAVAAAERRAAQAIAPEATSMVAVFEASIGTDRPWMPRITALVLAFVALVVMLDLRSARLALLALTPVVVGGLTACGLLHAFGFVFNTVTLIGIPLLVGLGVDDGIHVAHRLQEEPERSVEEVVGSVAPAVVMTTATTCASVSTLLFAKHPGIESLAVLLLVGLPMCMLATAWVLPALATLLRLRPAPRASRRPA